MWDNFKEEQLKTLVKEKKEYLDQKRVVLKEIDKIKEMVMKSDRVITFNTEVLPDNYFDPYNGPVTKRITIEYNE